MGRETTIEWTDATWNPIRGCSRVSEGCRNCYAETQAARWTGPGQPYEGLAKIVTRPNGTKEARWTGKVAFIEKHLMDPVRWRRPSRVFTNSMSDLFHEDIPDEWIDKIFAVMALASAHTFQILTKRPERMKRYVGSNTTPGRIFAHIGDIVRQMKLSDAAHRAALDRLGHWPLQNVWMGVSVEDQAAADERIPLLLQTPAAVRFISAEPLLGPVEIGRIVRDATLGGHLCNDGHMRPIDWVIVGGESGPHARPMHPEWARRLRDECQGAGVAYFFKQWGAWAPTHPDWPKAPAYTMAFDGSLYRSEELAYPEGARRGEAMRAGHDKPGTHLTAMYLQAKRDAGRELDGKTYDEYPETAA